jgi:hypothetical protein
MTDIRERLIESVGGLERFAQSFSNRTFSDLNRRAEMEVADAVQIIEEAIERVEKAIAAEQLEAYHSGSAALEKVLIRAWAIFQKSNARVANWFVTGPANFPVARNNKRIDAADRRYAEFREIASKAPARSVRIARMKQRAQIGAGGLADIELADLKQRLETRQLRHRMMKAVNECIRREKLGRNEESVNRLAEAMKERGFPQITVSAAVHLLNPQYGSLGYQSFSLSNNNAEIHRLEARIRQVEAKMARIETAPDEAPEREVNGVRVVEDLADDRLRLLFPGKPDRETISALKSRGFRWSPSNGAWQRQLTNNAREAAQQILRQVEAA